VGPQRKLRERKPKGIGLQDKTDALWELPRR
jgi:hypothetical protein